MDAFACRTGSAFERFCVSSTLGSVYAEADFDDGTVDVALGYCIDAPAALPAGSAHNEGEQAVPSFFWRA